VPPIWTIADGAYRVPVRLIRPPPDREIGGWAYVELGTDALSCQTRRLL